MSDIKMVTASKMVAFFGHTVSPIQFDKTGDVTGLFQVQQLITKTRFVTKILSRFLTKLRFISKFRIRFLNSNIRKNVVVRIWFP